MRQRLLRLQIAPQTSPDNCWNFLANYIAIYQMSATIKGYRNVDAEIWGVGTSAALKLTTDLELKLGLNYNQGDDLTWSRPLPEIAPLTGYATISFDNHSLFALLSERFSSRQWRTDTAMGEQPNPSWAVTDISCGYRFKKATLSAGINNVADTHYSTHLLHLRDPLATGVKVPEAGRFIWGMLDIML